MEKSKVHIFVEHSSARPAMIASVTDLMLQPAPIEPSWVCAGKPQAHNAVLSCSSDRTASTIVWDCTAGEFDWHYDIDETIYFIEGSAIIGDGHAPPRRFTAGDVLFLPKGTAAHWHVETYVRKVAFCRRTLPAPLSFGWRAVRKLRRICGRMVAMIVSRFGTRRSAVAAGALQPSFSGL